MVTHHNTYKTSMAPVAHSINLSTPFRPSPMVGITLGPMVGSKQSSRMVLPPTNQLTVGNMRRSVDPTWRDTPAHTSMQLPSGRRAYNPPSLYELEKALVSHHGQKNLLTGSSPCLQNNMNQDFCQKQWATDFSSNGGCRSASKAVNQPCSMH